MYNIRPYLAGDEHELVRIFSQRYGRYPGFMPQTEEDWRWCCLRRPGVGSDGVRVLTEGSRAVGYAVVGRAGTVWEFAYEPRPDSKQIVRALLVDVMNYLEENGAGTIDFSVPREDTLLQQALKELGFERFHRKTIPVVRCVDYPGLLRAIITRKGPIPGLEAEQVLLRLYGEPPPDIDVLVVDGARVTQAPALIPTVTIMASKPSLLVMIVGANSLGKMLLRGDLKVTPFWKIRVALRLLAGLRLGNAWFTPASGRG